MLVDDAWSHVLSSAVHQFERRNLASKHVLCNQILTNGENLSILQDDIRLFDPAFCFTCPDGSASNPCGLRLRSFRVAVSCEWPNYFSDLGTRLCRFIDLRWGLIIGLRFLADGAPFKPCAVTSLSFSFPNSAIHPDVARSAPPAIQVQSVQGEFKSDRPTIQFHSQFEFR